MLQKFINKCALYLLKISLAFTYIFCCCLLAVYCDGSNQNNKSNAYQTTKITYAKILENCILYKKESMSNDKSNIWFYLPTTYFVSIISTINENIYKVQYNNFIGFCYSDKLSLVSFEPHNKYLQNIYFDIAEDIGTQLWSEPSDITGKKLVTVSAGTLQLEYISSTIGDIPLGRTVNLWYYARYTPINNSTSVYEGYIHSEAVTNLTNIPNNLEVENVADNTITTSTIPLNNSLKIILVILISLPFLVLFVISIIKLSKQIKLKRQISVSNTTNTKPVELPSHTLFKKKTLPKNLKTDSNDTIEIVFPEYDYIDDDDLL